ncbi:MAG TPA: hypothetical protein VGE93_01610, partial [Bryobacteraceae bacterium]
PGEKALTSTYTSKDDPDNRIRLSVRGNQLVVTQLWDKKEIPLDALAENYFYNTPESYSLLIKKDDTGAVTGVLILGTDLFTKD